MTILTIRQAKINHGLATLVGDIPTMYANL